MVTVANLGDSTCMLDTGSVLMPVSVDHRVATHQQERRRLEALGALIAPIDLSCAPSALSSWPFHV